MVAPRKYPPELRERAVRMVIDARKDPATRPAAPLVDAAGGRRARRSGERHRMAAARGTVVRVQRWGTSVDRAGAARCARVAGGTATGGLVTLAVMFAVEVPKGGPFVFGTTNDALGVVSNVLFLPVFAHLGSELPAGPTRDVLLPATLGATVLGAVSGALLVARVLPFAPSTVLSMAAAETQAMWMLVAHDRLLRLPGFPRRLGRLGRAIGAAMLSGSLVAGLGLALPSGSLARRVAFIAGAVPGAAAWAAWPAWLHLAARYLDGPPAAAQ